MTVFRWVRGIRDNPPLCATPDNPVLRVGADDLPYHCPFCGYFQDERELLVAYRMWWNIETGKWDARGLEGGCLNCGAEYVVGFDAPDEMPEMPSIEDRGAGDG